jgi:hypothetical protein
MKNLNAIQCGETFKNTGLCGCVFDPKLIIGKIMIPKSRVLTKAELNDIQATLEGLVQEAKASRIYPVQGLVAVTDSTEEPTFQTFGYGSTAPVKEGNYNWVFELSAVGVDFNNALRSFNGSSKYAEIYFDSQNRLIGTLKKDVDGNNGLAGVPQNGGYPYTYPWKVNDGSKGTQYRTQSVFRPEYVNENIAYFEVDTTTYLLSELAGLQDIKLTVVEVNDDTVTVTATSCGEDVYEMFADEFANEEAWSIKDENGDTLVVSAAAKNVGAKGWDITFPATIVDGSTISLSAPATLAEAPVSVTGYESDEVTIAVGS